MKFRGAFLIGSILLTVLLIIILILGIVNHNSILIGTSIILLGVCVISIALSIKPPATGGEIDLE
ncbi:MAG: hypothetical protein P8X73_13445 [Ignavibacteriaceae bacterium]|jgi:hypothetical protein